MPLSNQATGLIYGLTSYLLWGAFPIFFHALDHVSAVEILSHRILWSFVFVGVLLVLTGRIASTMVVLRTPGAWKSFLLSSLLISTNWFAFIWTVTQDDILASSLGYFITPLVSVMLARVFLDERLDLFQLIACLLAIAAVCWQVFSHENLPIISIVLALTFGLYGLVRKQQKADTVTGLFLETAFIMPFAAVYIVFLAANHAGSFLQSGSYTTLLLTLSGVVTAIPLLAFAAGAKRLPLSIIGFLLYINPTIQFLIAVFMYDEHFDHNSMITFSLIWVALGLFSWGSWRSRPRVIPA